MFKPKNILIVGGNAAGPAAAAKARRVNPDASIMMFEAGDFISTGTCELPYVISGEIEDYRNIVFFDAKTFKQKKNVDVYTNHFVESIERRKKEIFVRDLKTGIIKSQKYDALILATGSAANRLPSIPANAENVFYLKNVSDLLSIKNFLQNNDVKTAAVIGSGYIGLEAAEALHKIGIEIKLFEKELYPMPGAEPEIQKLIEEELIEKGIEFFGTADGYTFLTKNNRIQNIKINSRLIETDMIVVAAGVSPRVDMARAAGISIGTTDAIKTDTRLKTSDFNIFAAGDNSEIINGITGRPFYLPVATVAHMNGHVAGENAAGGNAFTRPVIKNVSVKIFDNVLVTVGLNFEQAEYYKPGCKSVSATVPSIVKVMPGSGNLFGKIIYDNYNQTILGASFFGKGEVAGYGNMIAMMIKNRIRLNELSNIDFNYTPPVSPLINILSVLSRQINR